MNAQTPGSDPVYKRLYAFPEMVADLLRSLFPDNALGADYETLRRLPAEYVTTVPPILGQRWQHQRRRLI